jgi:hypothetical protein
MGTISPLPAEIARTWQPGLLPMRTGWIFSRPQQIYVPNAEFLAHVEVLLPIAKHLNWMTQNQWASTMMIKKFIIIKPMRK